MSTSNTEGKVQSEVQGAVQQSVKNFNFSLGNALKGAFSNFLSASFSNSMSNMLNDSFNKTINKSVTHIKNETTYITNIVNPVMGQLDSLQGKIEETNQKTQSLSSKIGGALKSGFSSLSGLDLSSPMSAVTSIAKIGMESEKTAALMGLYTGSQEAANKLLDECNQYAAKSPYQKLGMQEAATSMLKLGVSSDQVSGTLRMLGDVAMGDQGKLQELSVAMATISTAGRMQKEEFDSLVKAGYNPLQDIADLTGEKVEELEEKLKNEGLSADLVSLALRKATSEGGQFHGMSDRLANTSWAKLENMTKTLENTFLELFRAVQPVLIPALDGLGIVISALAPVIEGVASSINWFLTGLLEGNPVVLSFATTLAIFTVVAKGATIATNLKTNAIKVAAFATRTWDKAQKGLNATFKANPIGFVIGVIAGLITVVMACWNKFAGFRAFLITTWGILKEFLFGLWEGLKGVGLALTGNLDGAAEAFEKSGEHFSKGAEKVSNFKKDFQKEMAEQEELQKEYDGAEGKDTNYVPDANLSNHILGTAPGTAAALTPGGKPAAGAANSAAIIGGGAPGQKIQVTVAKFFDTLNVHMEEATDTAEIEQIVTNCMTRSLAIATSTAR